MLSICIPIYNVDIRPTVQRLAAQREALDVPVEIVCIDDHSLENFHILNSDIAHEALYIRLPQNVGRARIRNLFLQHTAYDNLLFLDCDSLIPDGFLSCYVEALRSQPQVVCGGRVYDPTSDNRQHHLRYRYGVRCECRDAAIRRRNPHKSFMTNNFIVRKAVLQNIPFDERISQYGHEDTLFGYRLQQADIPILHIDNPVINGDVETNAEFLRKTVDGVGSLSAIYSWMKDEPRFCNQVSLLRCYVRLRRLRLDRLIVVAFRLTKPLLENIFLRGWPICIPLFSFYKLGLFCQIRQHNKE